MLRIVFKNGEVLVYRGSDFSDYTYDGKCLIVIRGKQWVGIYNIDAISAMQYVDEPQPVQYANNSDVQYVNNADVAQEAAPESENENAV